MQKIWVNKADSFSDAEQFERSYYSEMLPSERLDTIQWLREEYFRSHKMEIGNEGGKRLRRVLEIDEVGFYRRSSGLWAMRSLTRVYFGTAGDISITR